MAKIKHIQLKVSDRLQSAAIYEKIFGFERTDERRTRDDHNTVHLADGTIDLAFSQYDEGSAEATMHGDGPKIGHFGIEVDDIDECVSLLAEHKCEFLTPKGALPVKFKIPGVGGIVEIGPVGFFKHPRDPQFKKDMLKKA
ncbi:MAG: VOC family protein [Rhodospirillaceae bacterium]|jgi:lactoylglutathione lyase